MPFYKEQLLQTGFVIDNEYLDLYTQLINANEVTIKEKFRTQCHHSIPCACYGSRVDADKDKLNLKVNLLFKDHILAHYYLCLCAKESSFRYKMIAAIEFTLGKSKNVSQSDIVSAMKGWLLEDAVFQKAYEEYAQLRYLRLHNPECREKARQKLLGHATSDETKRKISEANKGKEVSAEVRHKLSIARKGKSSWNKGLPANNVGKKAVYNPETLEILYVEIEQVPKYETIGWVAGNPKSGRKNGKGTRDRKVRCIDTDIVFNSLKEAAAHTGVGSTAIHQCLSGRSKTAGKYHWEYADQC